MPQNYNFSGSFVTEALVDKDTDLLTSYCFKRRIEQSYTFFYTFKLFFIFSLHLKGANKKNQPIRSTRPVPDEIGYIQTQLCWFSIGKMHILIHLCITNLVYPMPTINNTILKKTVIFNNKMYQTKMKTMIFQEIK